jgi:hypothetical protein
MQPSRNLEEKETTGIRKLYSTSSHYDRSHRRNNVHDHRYRTFFFLQRSVGVVQTSFKGWMSADDAGNVLRLLAGELPTSTAPFVSTFDSTAAPHLYLHLHFSLDQSFLSRIDIVTTDARVEGIKMKLPQRRQLQLGELLERR